MQSQEYGPELFLLFNLLETLDLLDSIKHRLIFVVWDLPFLYFYFLKIIIIWMLSLGHNRVFGRKA